jgi:hypothetical protein
MGGTERRRRRFARRTRKTEPESGDRTNVIHSSARVQVTVGFAAAVRLVSNLERAAVRRLAPVAPIFLRIADPAVGVDFVDEHLERLADLAKTARSS